MGSLTFKIGLTSSLVFLSAWGHCFAQESAPPKPEWISKYVDQGQFDPRLKGYSTPEGIRVEIVAEAPAVLNPVAMTFSVDGTLYVLEWRPDQEASVKEVQQTVTYRDGSTRKLLTQTKRSKDVVKILRPNKDQIYDKAESVLEDELPTSILVLDDCIYLMGQGSLRRYRQSKPGGAYDIKETLAQGFGGKVAGLSLGPDDLLYLRASAGDHHVEGSDGGRVTVLGTGAVFCCRPDGSKLRVFATGLQSSHGELASDSGLNLFLADTETFGQGKQLKHRLLHIVRGGDFATSLARVDGDQTEGKEPLSLPALAAGRGASSGLLLYNDTFFPEPYRGQLLSANFDEHAVQAFRPEPRGASFAVAEEFPLLKSDDPLFRPTQMTVGPDGAIYICDWRSASRPSQALWGDGKQGRIYRLRWTGTNDLPAISLRAMNSWAMIGKRNDSDLLATLRSESFSDRLVSQRALIRRGPGALRSVADLLRDKKEPLSGRMAAIAVVESQWNADLRKLMLQLLEDPEPEIRRLSADALSAHAAHGDEEAHHALLQILGDQEPAVRRAVACAMGRIAAPGAADALANALRFEESKDLYVRNGLISGLEATGKIGIDRLLAVADSGVEKDRSLVVRAFLNLHTRPAAEALAGLLRNPHLSVPERAALMRSYAHYRLDPPISLEPAVEYLLAFPGEDAQVKLAGLDVLAHRPKGQLEKLEKLWQSLKEDSNAEVRKKAHALQDGRK